MNRVFKKIIFLFLWSLLVQHYCTGQAAAWKEMQKAESLLRAENVEGADTILKQLIKETLNEPGWNCN